MLARTKSESDVFCVLWRCPFQLLLRLAYHYIRWIEAFVAIQIVKQEAACIQRLLNCFIRSIAPLEAIVDITRSRCVFLCLYRVKICIFFPQILTPMIKIAVVDTTSHHTHFEIQLESLCVCGHYKTMQKYYDRQQLL